jgi:hypothetical protein
MASLVVMLRVHVIDHWSRSVSQNSAAVALAVRVGIRQRRQDAPAALEQAGEAGIRAGIFGAGNRVAGNEMDALGICGAICAMTEPLVEPTSVTIAPGFSVRGDLLGDRAGGADGHRDDDQIGILDRFRSPIVV